MVVKPKEKKEEEPKKVDDKKPVKPDSSGGTIPIPIRVVKK